MSVADRVRDVVLPLLSARDLDLYDLELSGPVLKVVIDGPEGLDLDVLADATRAVSRALDEADPIPGTYTLEVSSPGLERRLRTPRHFARAVGESVKVKLTAAGGATRDGLRRLEGEVTAADDESVTVRTDTGDERVAYDDIERARTVFEWGPTEKPGKGRRSASTNRSGAADAPASSTRDEEKDQTP
jgi:ribosome maturation factor RimP